MIGRRGLLIMLTACLLAAGACSPPRFLREMFGRRAAPARLAPPEPPPPPSQLLLGVIVTTNSASWRLLLSGVDASGVLILGVIPQTWAASAGLARGDVIVAVDGIATPGSERLISLLRSSPSPTHRLTVDRPGRQVRTMEATLTPPTAFSTTDFVRQGYVENPDPVTRFLYAQYSEDAAESLAIVDRLLAEVPRFAPAHALRARRLLEQAAASGGGDTLAAGDVAAIRTEVAQAIELDPDSVEIRVTAARMYFSLNQQAESRREAARAVAIDGTSAEARFVLGLVLLATGQQGIALPHLHEAVRLNPYDLDYYAGLARGYALTGQQRSAERTIESAKSLVDDPEILARLDAVLTPPSPTPTG